jgi:DNA-binding PadR family transcriptional regulator
VYPTLQMLEDEGLVQSAERDGKRVFEITDEGRAEAARRIEDAGGAPWDLLDGRGGARDLHRALSQFAVATSQVGAVGNAAQIERAVGILQDARKQLYQILAES